MEAICHSVKSAYERSAKVEVESLRAATSAGAVCHSQAMLTPARGAPINAAYGQFIPDEGEPSMRRSATLTASLSTLLTAGLAAHLALFKWMRAHVPRSSATSSRRRVPNTRAGAWVMVSFRGFCRSSTFDGKLESAFTYLSSEEGKGGCCSEFTTSPIVSTGRRYER